MNSTVELLKNLDYVTDSDMLDYLFLQQLDIKEEMESETRSVVMEVK
jgi:hypothetical protein